MKFSSNFSVARKKARKCGIILLLMENRSEDGRYEDSCGIIIIFMQSMKMVESMGRGNNQIYSIQRRDKYK